MADDLAMMWDEVADIGTLLHELDDAAFDTPSLCKGWAVRDVLGHLAFTCTTSAGTWLGLIARDRFKVNTFQESKVLLAERTAGEIRRFWDDVMIAQHPRKGIAKLVPAKYFFLDVLVHNQDIRRPTGAPRTIPSERLVRALEQVRSEATPGFNPKRNIRGLMLRASDIGWTAGEGPVVEGPAEAIVMAAGGRAAALDDLTGEGVRIMRGRIGT